MVSPVQTLPGPPRSGARNRLTLRSQTGATVCANAADIVAYVDGALLVDLWDDLVLPRAVRSAWAPVIHASREMAA